MKGSKQLRLAALMAAALLVVAVVVFFHGAQGRLVGGFPFRDNMLQASTGVVLALSVVALFLERAMAVVNALVFGDEQRSAEVALVSGENLEVAYDKIAVVLGKKERLRLLVGFVVGVFVSASGARTLEGLFDLSGTTGAANVLLFPVDILLTAGLLAGGSNGLAFLVQTLKDRLVPDGQHSSRDALRSRVVTTS